MQIYPKYFVEHNIIVVGHLVQSIGITLFRDKMGLQFDSHLAKSIHTEGPTLPLNYFGFCLRVSKNTECPFHHKHSEAKLSKAE